MAYNIKSIKKEFAEKGIFYTQPELANYVKSFLPADVKEVYDPTCGNGGLLSVFDDDVEKYGQEINAEQLADAEKYLSNFHGVCGDTLKNPAWIDRKFDYIVANPPFGIKWEPPKMDMFDSDPRFEGVPAMPSRGMADFAFMLHILYLLSETGVAVVLDSHSVLFRDGNEGKIRQWMLERNCIEKIVYVPENQFVDTKIKTCIWVLNKHKASTDDDEYNRLLEYCKRNNEKYYWILRFLAGTGVRISELARLKKSHLQKGYAEMHSKGKERRILIPKNLIQESAYFFQAKKDDDYLFLSKQGNQLSERSVNSTLHSLGEKAKVRKDILHPHAFRHYFAIKMLKATNNDISLVSSLLGHSKIGTTAIYTMRTLKE